MTIRDQDIERRLQLGKEDSEWEFKQIRFCNDTPVGPKPSKLTHTIIAFANRKGGNLLCSVTNNGNVRNMSSTQAEKLLNMLTDISSDSILPPITIHASLRLLSSQLILLVEVPEGDFAHKNRNGIGYIRSGNRILPMDPNKFRALEKTRKRPFASWFDEQPMPGTNFEMLDENLWRPMLSDEGQKSPELGLEKIQLLTQDEFGKRRATVAGILVCSATPEKWLPNARIEAVLYKGNDPASGELETKTFRGPVSLQIKEVLSFAHSNIQTEMPEELSQTSKPRYSKRALFEAIVNAVAHRDYSIEDEQSCIQFLMFADRIEIYSPGALPGSLSIKNILTRREARNKILVSSLRRMHTGRIAGANKNKLFMEALGDGMSTILHETHKLSGKRPKYNLIDNFKFHLVIPASFSNSKTHDFGSQK